MSDVEEAPSCAKVGGKRKFEEDQYYVHHGEEIIRVSAQKTKEYESQQAAELASQAAAQARTKEQEALQATEKEKQVTVDKQITLAQLQLQLQTLPPPPPPVSSSTPAAPAVQPLSTAPIFSAAAKKQNPEKKCKFLDIYVEGRFPRLSGYWFGRVARYVRDMYQGKYTEVVEFDGNNHLYPMLTTEEVKEWIRVWLADESL